MNNPPGNAVRLPRTIEEVTSEWLTAALQARHPGVVVTASKVDPTMGYKPNKARVHLEYNDAGIQAGLPSTMVVKATFPGLGSSAAGLDFATAAEVLAYRDIVPRLDVNTPHCFFIGLDWEQGNAVLLMEDLDRKKIVSLKHGPPLTYVQATAFLDTHARIHAPFWNSPVLKAGGEFGPASTLGNCRHRLYTEFLGMVVQPKWWADHVDLPRSTALPRKLRDQRRIEAAWKRLNEVMDSCAMTLVHGDEHMGNFYTEADGTPGVLDWFGRPERWPISYSYFLCNSLDSLDRRQWERPLLAHYLGRLTHYGAAAPSFEEAWYAYRCAVLFPFIVWFTNPGKWQPEALNTCNTARAALAMIDHDTLGLLEL